MLCISSIFFLSSYSSLLCDHLTASEILFMRRETLILFWPSVSKKKKQWPSFPKLLLAVVEAKPNQGCRGLVDFGTLQSTPARAGHVCVLPREIFSQNNPVQLKAGSILPLFPLKHHSRHQLLQNNRQCRSPHAEPGQKTESLITGSLSSPKLKASYLRKTQDLLSLLLLWAQPKGIIQGPGVWCWGREGSGLLCEAGVEHCQDWGQVNNILMSSNKESKAIKKEKIISRVIKLYLIYPESKGLYWMREEEGAGRERCEHRVLAQYFHWKTGKTVTLQRPVNPAFW